MGLKVLVADKIAQAGIDRLRAAADVEVVVQTGLAGEALLAAVSDVDGLIVRSATDVTAEVIAAAKRLRVVGRAGVGVDNIDVPAATKRGIVVLYSPEGNTLAAAEHTVAMLLAAARRIPQAHAALVERREWERGRFMGVQVAGKTLGVVGMGRIATEVAKRAKGLDMQVVGYDPFVSAERFARLGVQPRTVDELCAEADFITVHTPLTPETTHLIAEPQFALMKPDAIVINCARGGIIDEAALAAALQAGRIRGAAIDVFTEEPPFDSPLLAAPNLIATPHLGASTEEAQVSVSLDIAESMLRALRDEPVPNAFNVRFWKDDTFETLRPYLELSERLGRLYTGLGLPHGRVEVVYAGEAARAGNGALTAALLKGMLEPVLQSVNYVNAQLIAEEREIRLAETKSSAVEDYHSLITVRTVVNNVARELSGTVTGTGTPTLV
ncbi:MAG TPA: phosphoglycerate dehydrogenase, partial [Limnochordia bacterium]|nr:phosphoglycerate dehydrogenase [Limnochordia bacterium]